MTGIAGGIRGVREDERFRKGADGIQAEEQFSVFLENYEKLVYTLCLRMSGNPFDAQDLTQEAFLSAWRGWEDFDGLHERAWICRIATNKCLDFLKSRKRKEENLEEETLMAIPDHRSGPEGRYLAEESQEMVRKLCRSLSPPYDEIAEAHFCEGKSVREIAEEKGRNMKSVQTQVYRAKAQLKKLLKGGGGL